MFLSSLSLSQKKNRLCLEKPNPVISAALFNPNQLQIGYNEKSLKLLPFVVHLCAANMYTCACN